MGFPSERRGGQVIKPPAELLKLHRHSLTTLLVFGGQATDRRAVALSFHRASSVTRGPFVCVDCAREEGRLRSSLQALMADAAPDPGPDPIRGAWNGTLFLEEVEALSPECQRLLSWFAQHTLGGSVDADDGWPVRLAVGTPRDPDELNFLPELRDEIDKIRIDLDEVEAGAA
jgi:DNA-binding NtrC family response regulator